MAFDIIPVVDLMGGQAVAARGGRRDEYAPIRSALCEGSDPAPVARALLSVTGSNALYIADLDAIMGRAGQAREVRRLADALPGVAILLDAGFCDPGDTRAWSDVASVRPVLGSETLREVSHLASCPASSRSSAVSGHSPVIPAKAGIQRAVNREIALDPRISRGDDLDPGGAFILSLDFDSQGFRGPSELLEAAGLWPDTLIVMTLDRVGEAQGPDFDRLREIIARAENRRVIAAGGVRHMADIDALADAGAAGVLIASALHDKRIGQKEIAAFLERRRFL